MTVLQSLAHEFIVTVSTAAVWLAICQGLLLGAGCLVLGVWVARLVGLLTVDAPAGETLGVGLTCGLMVIAAWWAAIWSGGRSAFTPVALGFAIAIGLALAQRRRRPTADPDAALETPIEVAGDATASRWSRLRPMVLTSLAGGVFVVAVALLYGSTTAPSPRDGVQPIEFNDEAFYSILGRDLATTGTETNSTLSGFSDLDGVPTQTWYHWGELWLASAVIRVFGTDAMAARYFVVLPVVLLAAAAMTGTLVRRVAGTASRRAYLFGAIACLVLAPLPMISGPFFSSWAVGLIFGVTMYGMAAVAVLLALYCLAVLGRRPASWALAAFVGSAAAFILPAHIVIALLALVGLATVWVVRFARAIVATRRPPIVTPVWRRTFVASAIALAATVAWGLVTLHGIGGSGGGAQATVSSFNGSWTASVALTVLGAGALLTIPWAWLVFRKDGPARADVYLGTTAIVIAGALIWGAKLADFTMFHFFFGGIAVFATPVAAVAVWALWARWRQSQFRSIAVVVVALCILQLELGLATGMVRLRAFGPGEYQPIPASLLEAIKQLPIDAKLAYACTPLEEFAFADQRLLSIDAHTGRRVVPMCFVADRFSAMIGAELSPLAPSPDFESAPQSALYPDATAHPSPAAVAAFLDNHGIQYIYADRTHPNSLVAGAIPVATSGDHAVLRVP